MLTKDWPARLSIVDVKATDEVGQFCPIEVQLLTQRALPARVPYGWADSDSARRQSGERYGVRRPAYCI